MKTMITRAFTPMVLALVLLAQSLAGCASSNAPATLQNGRDATSVALLETQTKAVQQNTAPAVTRTAEEEFYHSAWQTAKDNFLWQDRMTDWDKWEHKFDGQLKTMGDAERAINEMLGSLKDGYTYFKDATVTSSSQTRSGQSNVVTHRMLPNNIGYIKIRTFGSVNTASEVKAALTALSSADGYIIDLRDNGGGFIWQAFNVFSLFVDTGKFTTLEGWLNGKAYKEELIVSATNLEQIVNGTKTLNGRDTNLTGNKPVTILVNGDSASASEMLSGAMRDNGRATLIGTKTYGKGIAQITYNLAHGTSMQVTFAQYITPGGTKLHGIGLTPDTVSNKAATGDAQLDEAVKHIKKELGK
jgi:hypothetical protein